MEAPSGTIFENNKTAVNVTMRSDASTGGAIAFQNLTAE